MSHQNGVEKARKKKERKSLTFDTCQDDTCQDATLTLCQSQNRIFETTRGPGATSLT
jgi:hypothetical protein